MTPPQCVYEYGLLCIILTDILTLIFYIAGFDSHGFEAVDALPGIDRFPKPSTSSERLGRGIHTSMGESGLLHSAGPYGSVPHGVEHYHDEHNLMGSTRGYVREERLPGPDMGGYDPLDPSQGYQPHIQKKTKVVNTDHYTDRIRTRTLMPHIQKI